MERRAQWLVVGKRNAARANRRVELGIVKTQIKYGRSDSQRPPDPSWDYVRGRPKNNT
jgi:hypothetical protein